MTSENIHNTDHLAHQHDRVSVIMPVFNSSRFLRDSVGSVLSQTYRNLELIAVDDCSTDGSQELIEEFALADSRIHLLENQRNSGAAFSRNRALAAATGRYVAFLDADDAWLPDKLERQLAFMTERSAAFSFTPFELCTEDGRPTGRMVDRTCPDVLSYNDMLKKWATLGCSTVIIDRSLAGPLRMPEIRTGQDYALWLRILKRGHNAHRFPEAMTRYRLVPGSISSNKLKKARRQWQIYREIEAIPVPSAVWYFANYAFHAMVRP